MGGRVGDPGPLPPILHPCPKGERLQAGLADQGLSHVESGVGHPEPPKRLEVSPSPADEGEGVADGGGVGSRRAAEYPTQGWGSRLSLSHPDRMRKTVISPAAAFRGREKAHCS